MEKFFDKKISVIIPIYNVEKYLDNCIKSIANQTYTNLEIILIDDGSPDNCPEMCDAWAERDSRIKVIHKKNGGASSARNAGLDMATGDYIAFVDGDDYLDEDMYEIMLGQIMEYRADMVSCGIVRESPNGFKEIWDSYDAPVEIRNNTQLLKLVGEAAGILPVSPCNKLFRAETVQGVRYNERFKYAEDTLFNFEAAKNIKKAVIQNVPRYHYVSNADSASHQVFNRDRFDEHKVMDIIFDLAKENKDVLLYCVKGDILKSFRTIREMCTFDACTENFKSIRLRIVNHKSEIFKSGIYSKATKLKTLFLWFFPDIYKFAIKLYGKRTEKSFIKQSA